MNTSKGKKSVMLVFLIMLNVAVTSGVVVTSNQYFDRTQRPNFGTEVTFYGLGLNLSWPMNYSQITVQSIMECKSIFRVVLTCISAFAKRQNNGTVLCTYFNQPLYTLPTIAEEKNTSYAFYKESEVPYLNYSLTTNALLNNGKFYIFQPPSLCKYSYRNCQQFPNGYVLRPKTKADFRNVFNNPQVNLLVQNDDTRLDLHTDSTSNKLKWGDGTLFDQSEAASLYVAPASFINGASFVVRGSGRPVSKVTIIAYGPYYPTYCSTTCEINTFLASQIN